MTQGLLDDGVVKVYKGFPPEEVGRLYRLPNVGHDILPDREHKYKLPVTLETITDLGMNPLLEKWKHSSYSRRITEQFVQGLGFANLSEAPFIKYLVDKKEQEFAWDFAVPIGTPIYAARSGRVYEVRCDSDLELKEGKKFNLLDLQNVETMLSLDEATNKIIVHHDDDTFAVYAHLMKDGSMVRGCDYVNEGAHIGYSGNTGLSTFPHLHFEVHDDSKRSIDVRFNEETTQAILQIARKKLSLVDRVLLHRPRVRSH